MPKKRNAKQYRLLFFFIGCLCGAVVMFLIFFMKNSELRPQKGVIGSEKMPYETRDPEAFLHRKNKNQQQQKSDSQIATIQRKDSSHTMFAGNDAFAIETNSEGVAADKLLFTRIISFPSIENSDVDTLPKHFPGTGSQKLKVEFWQSPMNSVGYQMYPNRLVLFGFYDSTKVQIISHENSFKLIYEQDTYSIAPSDQYESIYLK